jgi:hypothetical protein
VPGTALASATAATAFAFVLDPEPVVDDEPELEIAPSRVPIPWFIEINCWRLFTCASCVMYAFGSVGCVGSWFFNSLTRRVRKSSEVMLDESLAALLELLVVGAVASFGFACTARGEDKAVATVVAADVPDVAIELSCDKSIACSPHFKVHSIWSVYARTLNQLPPLA